LSRGKTEKETCSLGSWVSEPAWAVNSFSACTLILEAILPLDSTRFYPVCIGGKRGAPPEGCTGAWAYMERLDQHRSHPPLEAMLVAVEAVRALLEADPHTSVREALDLDELREVVDCLETYQAFQPEHFDRGDIDRQLHAWG
jgi:Plasmid pRiA4b ORF-3-like protein